jgi:hypothetical protein
MGIGMHDRSSIPSTEDEWRRRLTRRAVRRAPQQGAPIYVNGVGCGKDLAQAGYRLVCETGAAIDAANDRTRRLVADPAYRRTFRMIERALMSRPVLSGDDVAVLLAP